MTNPPDHLKDRSTKDLSIAFFLNLGFFIIEVIGGILTNSMAILSDAVHDFGDCMSIGMAWYLENYSKKDTDKTFSYGYRRFSILGALINAVILVVGSFYIISQAIPAISDPEQADAEGMMWLAIVGVVVNSLAALRLKKGKGLNQRILYLHLLEDVLGWVAVLVGSIVMQFYDVPELDPILSLGIAAFILYNVFRNLRRSLKIFLQAIPEDVDLESIRNRIEGLDGVKGIHDLHVWSMDGQYNILTAHVELLSHHSMDELHGFKKKVKECLYNENINHTTIEFEYPDEPELDEDHY